MKSSQSKCPGTLPAPGPCCLSTEPRTHVSPTTQQLCRMQMTSNNILKLRIQKAGSTGRVGLMNWGWSQEEGGPGRQHVCGAPHTALLSGGHKCVHSSFTHPRELPGLSPGVRRPSHLFNKLCQTLSGPMDCGPPGSCPWDFPGKNITVGD